ncbi:hypothetical protein A2Y99_01785 [Candidatus Gottesmanbacteria bacterium RBG_13_37_7]|uniref:Uncharacterized protein n=1 Tax=Candidatus Gottesmanbacteria bacterium RBG_13_37_7 TaxID=1798369 RepID=A0A1F5YI42_9BACT|nr:MAG: hypothetical protein A2Y99_01785 [Candidatus Gottesmanbacteria bacterium RBG_13_37_7]
MNLQECRQRIKGVPGHVIDTRDLSLIEGEVIIGIVRKGQPEIVTVTGNKGKLGLIRGILPQPGDLVLLHKLPILGTKVTRIR